MHRRDRRKERDRLKKEKARKDKEDADAALAGEIAAAAAAAVKSAEAARPEEAEASTKIELDDLPDEATIMMQLGFGGFATTKVSACFGYPLVHLAPFPHNQDIW